MRETLLSDLGVSKHAWQEGRYNFGTIVSHRVFTPTTAISEVRFAAHLRQGPDSDNPHPTQPNKGPQHLC